MVDFPPVSSTLIQPFSRFDRITLQLRTLKLGLPCSWWVPSAHNQRRCWSCALCVALLPLRLAVRPNTDCEYLSAARYHILKLAMHQSQRPLSASFRLSYDPACASYHWHFTQGGTLKISSFFQGIVPTAVLLRFQNMPFLLDHFWLQPFEVTRKRSQRKLDGGGLQSKVIVFFFYLFFCSKLS